MFTRCRPYRKNDQAWVEQKNGVVVRRTVGYRRYEGLEAAAALARLYSSLRQGCMLYDLLPTMRDACVAPLMQRFSQMLQEQPLFADVFGPV